MRADQNKFMSIINEFTGAHGNIYRKLHIYLWDYHWPSKSNILYILNKDYKTFINKLKELSGEILIAESTGKTIHINRKEN